MKSVAVPGRLFWSYRETPAGSPRPRTVVLSALKTLTIASKAISDSEEGSYVVVPSDTDSWIYGDTVIVHGPITAPGQTVRIFARELVFKTGTDGTQPCIDVSGVLGKSAPTDNPQNGVRGTTGNDANTGWGEKTTGSNGGPGADGVPGRSGDPGGAGGAIELFVDTIKIPADKPPRLAARGGNGGAGQPGMDGRAGGNGGKGGVIAAPWPDEGVQYLRNGDPGRGGNAGRAGRGGNGGACGTITVRSTMAIDKLFVFDVAPGAPGADPLFSGKLHDGVVGAGGSTEAIGRPEPNHTDKWNQAHGWPERHGSPGNLVPSVGPPAPTPGAAPPVAQPVIAKVDRDAFIDHMLPTHAAMLRDRLRAEMLSLGIGAGRRELVVPTLGWLDDVLAGSAGDDGKLDPALSKARPAESEQLYEVHGEVAILNSRDLTRRDIYGNGPNWAPLPNASGFMTELQLAVARLRKVKPQFDAYLEQLANNKVADMTAALNEAAAVRSQLLDKRAALIAHSTDLLHALATSSDVIDGLVGQLPAAEKDFEEAMSSKFSCSWESIMSALQMSAFVPPITFGEDHAGNGTSEWSGGGLAMAGLGLLSVLRDGYGKIEGSDGFSAEKAVLLQRIDKIDGDITKYAKPIYQDKYGLYSSKDTKDWARMVMSLEELEKLLVHFQNIDAVKPLLGAIRHLVREIETRSACLLEYNATVMNVREVERDVIKLDAETSAAKKRKENNTPVGIGPDTAALTSFWGYRYQRDLETATRAVYTANRAYAYWTLQPTYNVFAEILRPRSLWVVDDVSGYLTPEVLDECKAELDAQFAAHAKRFKSMQDTFLKDKEGIPLLITDASELARFRAGKLTIDLRRIAAAGCHYIPEFLAYGNIRLSSVRAYLEGARSTLDDITVSLSHGAADTFYNPDDAAAKPYVFVHDSSIGTEFTYNSKTNQPVTHGSFVDRTDHDLWLGVGPFTEWTLGWTEATNPGLDLKDLRAIRLEFRGWLFPNAVSSRH